jgi:hypothetical protein
MIAEIYAHQNLMYPFICQLLLMDVTPLRAGSENNARRVKLLGESGCKNDWQEIKDVITVRQERSEMGPHSGRAS